MYLLLLRIGVAAAAKAYRSYQQSSSPPGSAPPSLTPPPARVITFVGATGAGKSSTLNALLGCAKFPVGQEHGTTTRVLEAQFRNGYRVRDTPGLLDSVDYRALVWNAVRDSELTIYTARQQLLRPELEFLEELAAKQRAWDAETGITGRRRLVLFVNAADVREAASPTTTRLREEQAIRTQVASWIPYDRIIFGAAAPIEGGVVQPPRIDALRALVHAHTDA
jgi:predicted GTPase